MADLGYTPDPSPTEEELEVMLTRCLMVRERDFSKDEVEYLIHALRAARESARVATRERDEAREEVSERKKLCDDLAEDAWDALAFYRCATCQHEQREHCHTRGETERACCACSCDVYVSDGKGIAPLAAERDTLRAQLTDRDQMIAGLREIFWQIIKLEGYGFFGPNQGVVALAHEALSTSHPIAAAFEARVAQERDDKEKA